MKVRLKNNTNLQLQTVQNKTSIESLYITGCPRINAWNIFSSIYETTGNKLRSIRLDGVNHIGTWSELQALKSNLNGLDPNGNETNVPVLIGTWTLPGMHVGEHDLAAEEAIWGGTLEIEVDKTLITFTDPTVNSIVNSLWGFEYDSGLYGVDINLVRTISDIGQNFTGAGIQSFDEFESFLGITTLGTDAFYNCSSLVSINLPPNIAASEDNAFSGCSSLTHITYPENTSLIGSNQTLGCTNLEYIRILRSSGITRIQPDSFPGDFMIYVGDGSSPWHDNRILNILLTNDNWKLYENRLDTWYNKIYKDLVPSSYKKLDYIESDAYNYITTNVEFTNNTRFVADISFISASESIYGSAQSGIRGIVGGGLKFTVLNKNTDNEMAVTFFNSSAWVDSGENLYDIDIKGGTVSFNGSNLLNAQVKSNGGDITLFGDENNKYIGRTWMTRIYENGDLIHDFVPVYKKSTLEAGLYDVITDSFSGFSTYTGDGFDTRLITENKRKLTTENNEYILISNTNTDKIKVSKMDQGGSYSNYYIPLIKSGIGNRKYNLGNLESEVANISDMSGLEDFKEYDYYIPGQFVSYQGNTYKFIANHVGPWVETDAIRTSAFDQLSILKKVQNKETLTVSLVSNESIPLDYIKSTGTNYINTGLVINNSATYRIEMKFKYDNFVAGDYIFGDYSGNLNLNMTRLALNSNNDGSGTCCMGSRASNGSIGIPAGVLTAGVDHTVVLSSGSVTIDGNTYTGTVTSGNSNTTTLGIFAGGGGGNSISGLGITLYYFKIYNNNRLVYNLTPALKLGKYGLDPQTQGIYGPSGSGSFLPPDNFINPFSGKNVTIRFADGSEDITLLTDEVGTCSATFRRDRYFEIIPEMPEGYYNTTQTKKNYKDIETSKICLRKEKTQEMTSINVNITLSDGSDIPSTFGSKTIYAFTDYTTLNQFRDKYSIYGITSVSGDKAITTISFPKNQNVLLVFPTISGYTKQSDMTITTTNDTETVNAVYTV